MPETKKLEILLCRWVDCVSYRYATQNRSGKATTSEELRIDTPSLCQCGITAFPSGSYISDLLETLKKCFTEAGKRQASLVCVAPEFIDLKLRVPHGLEYTNDSVKKLQYLSLGISSDLPVLRTGAPVCTTVS